MNVISKVVLSLLILDLSVSLDASFVEITSSCDVLLSLLTVFCNMLTSEKNSLLSTVKDASSKLKHQLFQFLEVILLLKRFTPSIVTFVWKRKIFYSVC